MLTKRQKQVFDFIIAYREEHGVSPSYREIAAESGIKSAGQIHAMVLAMEERGYIRRLPLRARAIEPIR